MDELEELYGAIRNNMQLFEMPAPTPATLERMQYTKKVINSVNWITEKHEITSIEELITTVKGLVNTKAEENITELEKDLLSTLTIQHIQNIADKPMKDVINDLRNMGNTRKYVKLPSVEQLTQIIVKDKVEGTQVARKMFKATSPLLKEVQQIQNEVGEYLRGQVIERYLFIDTETNSLPNRNIKDSGLPIQVAYILTDKEFNILKTENFYILQQWIDPGAENIHQISVEKLRTLSPLKPEEAYEQLRDLLEDKDVTVVAHNATFDIGVLKRLKEQAERSLNQGSRAYSKPISLCTLTKARKDIPKTVLKSKKLMDVSTHFGHNEQSILNKTREIFKVDCEAHDARFDTVALLGVAKGLKI